MFPGACFVKMSYFLLDFAIEMPYHLAPPQGREAVWIIENLAVSTQQSAIGQCWYLVPGIWYLGAGLRPSADWDWDWDWDWVAQGPPKGHPSATQGPRLGRIAKVLCLQQKLKNTGVGVGARRRIAEIARDRKGKISPWITWMTVIREGPGNLVIGASECGDRTKAA